MIFNQKLTVILLMFMAVTLILLRLLNNPLILLILPLLIPAAWFVFRLPVWICLGFILFSFFRIHEAIPALLPFRLPQLLALAAISVLLWHVFLTEQYKVYWHPIMGVLLVFFGFIVIGAITATDRGSAIGMLQSSFLKVITMVFAIAWIVRTPRDFHLASVLVMCAGLLIGGIAIYNKLHGIGLVEGTRVTIGRDIGSMIGDPNDLALVLTFPLSFAASAVLFADQKKKTRWLGILSCAIVIWAIICTQSRGGLLGVCGVFATLGWLKVKNKLLLIGFSAVLLVILLAISGIGDRTSGGRAEAGIDASAMGRIYAWQAAISMATHHPLTGVGINNFYANYYFHSPHWDGKNHAVHSTWFQLLAESGFVGLVLFSILVASAIQLARRNVQLCLNSRCFELNQTGPAILSGLSGFCISGTFLTQGFTWPLYILLALTIALTHFFQQQE